MKDYGYNYKIYSKKLKVLIPRPVRIKSFQRTILQHWIDEPAWAFAGQKTEHERLTRMLKRVGVKVETVKDHKHLTIEITITI